MLPDMSFLCCWLFADISGSFVLNEKNSLMSQFVMELMSILQCSLTVMLANQTVEFSLK